MRFLEVIGGWINRYFSNEEAIYLVVLLAVALLVLLTLGGILAPVLAGLVIAFLLQTFVDRLTRWRVPRLLAVWTVFLLFGGGAVTIVVLVAPLIWQQLYESVNAMPAVIDRLGDVLADISGRYPGFFSPTVIDGWVATLNTQLTELGASALQGLVTQVPNVFASVLYLILLPITVFFFLKDRERLIARVLSLLPAQRPLLDRVGREMNVQIANYIRGKFLEIVIVGLASYGVFALLGLNYAALLGLMVGLSVLVPFIGAAVVTVPVAAVAFLQWGWSWDFAWLMAAYGIVQALDGNVLVPILFSEANDLHPIVIIVAVLAFGGLWGFWGVFFAIPLATLVKAILNAWPRQTASDPPVP
ncbi:MAG: AI-2E family transporter [Gammaproteobacteria bacterium]|nr:AI-2E family transporter [Gammaproteobacteria bacterium]MYE81485.1 AI-2E family transporter [Gammaproteobacteria bacterium]